MNSSGARSGRRGAWRTAFALVALVAAGLVPVAMAPPAQAAGSQVTATRTVYPAGGTTLWRGTPITITGTATAPGVGTTPTDVYIVLPIPGQTTMSTQTPPQISAGGHIEQPSDPAGLDAGAIGAHFPSIALGSTATFTATVVVDATSIKLAGPANDIPVARATIVQQPYGQWDVGAAAGYDLESVPRMTATRSVTVGGTPTAPPYLPGTVVDVSYTLSNTATPGDDATNVIFSDQVQNLDLGCTDTPPLTCKVDGIGKTAAKDADELWAGATSFGAQLGTIAGGQSRTVTYRATVAVHNPTRLEASATPHVVSIDSAMVEYDQSEPDTWDDRTPIATVDLALAVVPASTEQAPYGVHLGTPGVTTVSLGNLGPDAATTGLLVRISVEGASFTGATPAGCTAPSPTYYDCPVDPLAGGATWTRSVSVVSGTPVTAFVRARRLGTPPPQYNRNTTGDVGEAWFDIRDRVPPSAWLTSPGGVTLGGSVTVAWQGTDAHSALATYDVRYERAPYNGWFSAPEHPAAWQSSAATSATIGIEPGDTICFRVRARDVAGNLSDWSASRCVTRPLDDRALAAGRGWKRSKGAGFYGGTYTATTRKGATLTRTATQITQVGVVARTGPTCGRIGVYVGSRLVGRISLRSSRVSKQQVLMLAPFAPSSGKITVKALTGGRPIAIDGLVLGH